MLADYIDYLYFIDNSKALVVKFIVFGMVVEGSH